MNSKRLYKSHFFENYFALIIVVMPTIMFVIFCYIQIRDGWSKFDFSINELNKFIYVFGGFIYMYIAIVFILMLFIYSFVITNNYIEKKFLISTWKNKKIDIHDIVFIEFEVVSGYGGPFRHYLIHTEKEIILLECTNSYIKVYHALKRLNIEINVRQRIINVYPSHVKIAISKGMDIKVNPLLEKKYFKMKK